MANIKYSILIPSTFFVTLFVITSSKLMKPHRLQYNREFQLDDTPPICHSIPPALWCSCKRMAEECGFIDLCTKYMKSQWNGVVHLTLLYESLCPDCQEFITKELYPNLYNSKLNEIVRIELVPYGNAKQLENGTIVCQHGDLECKINRIESCAIHFLEKPLPYINCLEVALKNGKNLEKALQICYKNVHTIPHIYDQIIHCANNSLGIDLQQKAAQRTQSVWPDVHEKVPWMLFNNVSIKNQQFLLRDLPMAICQFYVGEKHAELCPGFGTYSLNKIDFYNYN